MYTTLTVGQPGYGNTQGTVADAEQYVGAAAYRNEMVAINENGGMQLLYGDANGSLTNVIPTGDCDYPTSAAFDPATGDLYWASIKGGGVGTTVAVCKWTECEFNAAILAGC